MSLDGQRSGKAFVGCRGNAHGPRVRSNSLCSVYVTHVRLSRIAHTTDSSVCVRQTGCERITIAQHTDDSLNRPRWKGGAIPDPSSPKKITNEKVRRTNSPIRNADTTQKKRRQQSVLCQKAKPCEETTKLRACLT